MKKISFLFTVVATLFFISCASNVVPFDPTKLEVKDGAVKEMNILYGVSAGSQPQPYPEKVKTTGTRGEDGTFSLYVVHTNDVHGRMDPADGGIGYPVLSSFISQLRERANGNVLLLDGGDVVHGTNLANFFNGENVMNLLGYIGYDAVTLGNHEFNYGLQQLDRNILIGLGRDVATVSNNIKLGGKRALPAYRIFSFNDFKVGVIGLTTPSTKTQTNPTFVKGIEFENALITDLQTTVNEVRSKADFVIVLGHIGVEPVGEGGFTSMSIAKGVNGIDLFIDAHSHTKMPQLLYEGSTAIAQTGEYLENIGVEVINVSKDNKVNKLEYYLVSEDDIAKPNMSTFLYTRKINEITPDKSVEEYIQSRKVKLEEVFKNPVAKIDKKYDSARAVVRATPCELGNVVTTAIAESVGADFGLLNGGSFRADLNPGIITVGDINNTLPFNNLVVLSSITGKGIYEALETGYAKLPDLAGGFPQTNLVIEADVSAPAGSRIKRVTLPNGTAVQKDDTVYKVATNDFLVVGGDGFTQFGSIIRYGGQVNQVVIDYFKAKFPIN